MLYYCMVPMGYSDPWVSIPCMDMADPWVPCRIDEFSATKDVTYKYRSVVPLQSKGTSKVDGFEYSEKPHIMFSD